MKKIIASVLSAALFATTFASAMTRDEFLAATALTETPEVVREKLDQPVEADILVKLSSDAEYGQGVVNIVKNASDAFPTFDFKAELYMDSVRNLFKNYIEKAEKLIGKEDTAGLAMLNSTPITGQFTVTITCPSDVTLPDYITDETSLNEAGFSEAADGVFKEVSRTLETGRNAQTLTIVLDVVGPEHKEGIPLTCKDLRDNLDKYLPDLELECDGVQPTAYGTKTISGKITGYTVIGDTTDPISTVNYEAVQRPGVNDDARGLSESISVAKKSTTGGGSSRPSSSGGIAIIPSSTISVVFDINGKTDLVDAITGPNSVTVNLDEVKAPEKEGLKFVGWHYDQEFLKPATGTVTFNSNAVLYGRYVITSGLDVFATDDHKLYIKGYPDGTVQPNGNITREEVAQALYRLLKDDVRDNITTSSNSFSDVAEDRWSNVSVSSMAAAGFINGYENGTFGPGKPITRAEFATIASRFFNASDADKSGIPYSDVPGHWAEDYIVAASNMYIIRGYSDGTFRPDQYITRAEAMTIINRMTVRHTDANGLIAGIKTWPDISESDWYYYEVLEATNSHSYVRRADGYYEDWSAIID
ncbi:MAG: S-layer homology domain-containing protein [Clostridia bacterium]|nr:S-layer homology domain-containing protein [Clostridia bacterium]